MAPFRSEAQRRYMWAKHPSIAKRWTKKYGSKIVPGGGGHSPVKFKRREETA